jgi:hypothetical protein
MFHLEEADKEEENHGETLSGPFASTQQIFFS